MSIASNYEAVIGLEVHIHLACKSKLFCSCSAKFGEKPNGNVCEICSAMPGALPSPNREAIRMAAILGLAVNCTINRNSVFARKNYFYPDLPAGYQISQYDLPVCSKGFLAIEADGKIKNIGITRIHMENDAGKNIHSQTQNISFVDLNRAGTPMVEVVSEPDLNSANEATAYLKKLHELVTYLGISDGNMEEGSFRCDANISLRPKNTSTLGTRTELKNLNSFRNVQKAIEYEIERQEELLLAGKNIKQETRLYDADKNITQSMRSKEEAQDYRYFPDPDLLPVQITEEELKSWQMNMPELPEKRKERFMKMANLASADADILLQSISLADYFEEAANMADPKKIASLVLGSLMRFCNARNLAPVPKNWKMDSKKLAELANLQTEGIISAKIAADIFADLFESGESPKEYVEKKGLAQISDNTLIEKIIDQIIQDNPEETNAYKNGKTKLISFFVGQVMKGTKGKANPAVVNEILKAKLSG